MRNVLIIHVAAIIIGVAGALPSPCLTKTDAKEFPANNDTDNTNNQIDNTDPTNVTASQEAPVKKNSTQASERFKRQAERTEKKTVETIRISKDETPRHENERKEVKKIETTYTREDVSPRYHDDHESANEQYFNNGNWQNHAPNNDGPSGRRFGDELSEQYRRASRRRSGQTGTRTGQTGVPGNLQDFIRGTTNTVNRFVTRTARDIRFKSENGTLDDNGNNDITCKQEDEENLKKEETRSEKVLTQLQLGKEVRKRRHISNAQQYNTMETFEKRKDNYGEIDKILNYMNSGRGILNTKYKNSGEDVIINKQKRRNFSGNRLKRGIVRTERSDRELLEDEDTAGIYDLDLPDEGEELVDSTRRRNRRRVRGEPRREESRWERNRERMERRECCRERERGWSVL